MGSCKDERNVHKTNVGTFSLDVCTLRLRLSDHFPTDGPNCTISNPRLGVAIPTSHGTWMPSTLERSKLGKREQTFPRVDGPASSPRIIFAQKSQRELPYVVEKNQCTDALQWVQLAGDVRI